MKLLATKRIGSKQALNGANKLSKGSQEGQAEGAEAEVGSEEREGGAGHFIFSTNLIKYIAPVACVY